MKSYEYFQETIESIVDDNWTKTLKKHGNQGWLLCSINREDIYEKRSSNGIDEKAEDDNTKMQTIYIATFQREL